MNTTGSDRTAGSFACCVRSRTGTSADLPVVAMNHVRQPDPLHQLDRHARKFREPLRVVRIIAGTCRRKIRRGRNIPDRPRKNNGRSPLASLPQSPESAPCRPAPPSRSRPAWTQSCSRDSAAAGRRPRAPTPPAPWAAPRPRRPGRPSSSMAVLRKHTNRIFMTPQTNAKR